MFVPSSDSNCAFFFFFFFGVSTFSFIDTTVVLNSCSEACFFFLDFVTSASTDDCSSFSLWSSFSPCSSFSWFFLFLAFFTLFGGEFSFVNEPSSAISRISFSEFSLGSWLILFLFFFFFDIFSSEIFSLSSLLFLSFKIKKYSIITN